MYDKELVKEILQQITDSIQKISRRFRLIKKADVFLTQKKVKTNLMPYACN